jgi:NitT/TauT family transport system ATP-binding protein
MSLLFDNVRKAYDGVVVLDGVSFECPPRSIVAVVGPSGSGKTTLLNIAAGLLHADAGHVTGVGDVGVLGYMLQEPLLLPWRTLEQNAALGGEVVYPRQDLRERLRDHLEGLELWNERTKYPEAASGGMKQRVALARTLLLEPNVLLLDEPFASLDFDIKLSVQRRLIDYRNARGTTIMWVTHDIDDAIAISDHVIVLSDKPTVVKARIQIDLGLPEANPVEARKSPLFREYFSQIWDQLRYLENDVDD